MPLICPEILVGKSEGPVKTQLDVCANKTEDEKPIYLILFLKDSLDIKNFKSNKLENSYCVMHTLGPDQEEDWIKKYCFVSFSEEEMKQKRVEYLKNE